MNRLDAMRRPPDLTGPAAEMWDQSVATLVRMGTLTEETRERFAAACRAHGCWRELHDDPDAPWRRQLAAQRLFMMRIRGFGMTPADRVRLVTAGKIGPEWLPGRSNAD